LDEIPLKGDLKEQSLPAILVHLNSIRATGTLRVRTGAFEKRMYLIEGNAIFASSTYEDDRLGEMLLKAGKINLEQYNRSVEMLKKTGKRQGAILVELGYLTPKDLFWGVKYQVQEIICSLFQLESGQYEFISGDVPEDEVITLKISMGKLIFEGVRRINNWTRIKREMPDMKQRLRLSSDPRRLFQEIDFGPDEKEILSLANGNRTIEEILNTFSKGSFPALKSLYILYSIGILELTEKEDGTESINIEDLTASIHEEEAEFVKEAEELFSRLHELSPSELLGISDNATPLEIKKRYYKLAKKFHPDRFFNIQHESVKSKLTVLFDAITKAYNSLKDGAVATSKPAMKESENEVEPVDNQTMAYEQYRRGMHEYKEGNYWQASEAFRWATRLDPERPLYWSYLGLSLCNQPRRLKEAEEAILQAIRLEPYKARHYANLGNIYLKAGLKKRARRQFEKALQYDPRNSVALKGLSETEEATR
jgi:tetratricopeptide (TPR) repeat protein